MDREAGIKAHGAMISADEQKRRRAAGLPPEHIYSVGEGKAPVLAVIVTKVEMMTGSIAKYEFSMPDGSDMPPVTAGAHIDVVVSPEYFRQFSLSGDPSDRSKYQVAVLREDEGRGGSKLMHRVFEKGRRVFISYPINEFPIVEDASFIFLMGGGIGVTPMIAIEHRLHAIGAEFSLHYSCSQRDQAGFLNDLENVAWSDKVRYHFSDQGSRADLQQTLMHRQNAHVYTCGPDPFMTSVMDVAQANGFPEEARHLEYFAVPELPEYVNHDFTFRLTKSGREISVRADEAPTDALLSAGLKIDVKCSDGLCGLCRCKVVSGELEHRDFVLSNQERKSHMILCQSRAAVENGTIEIDL